MSAHRTYILLLPITKKARRNRSTRLSGTTKMKTIRSFRWGRQNKNKESGANGRKRKWKKENEIYSQCNWTVISFSTGLISCDPCARHNIVVPKYVRGTERIRILFIIAPVAIDWWLVPGISTSFRHQDTFGVGKPPLTWHDKKNSWPSRNGPATVVISLPCVSNIRGSSGGTGVHTQNEWR